MFSMSDNQIMLVFSKAHSANFQDELESWGPEKREINWELNAGVQEASVPSGSNPGDKWGPECRSQQWEVDGGMTMRQLCYGNENDRSWSITG